MTRRVIVGLTGASGGCYGLKLIECLLALSVEVHLLVSAMGWRVLAHELDWPGPDLAGFLEWRFPPAERVGVLAVHDPADLFAPVASGSFPTQGMVVIPCSMKTLAAVAQGRAENLLERAADVTLKERRPLILVPRETPLSLIHLRNMVAAAEAGATILPACPPFYHRPRRIEELVDAVVARVLDQLGLDHHLVPRWGEVDRG